MTNLIRHLMAWYGCTEEAAEHIARSAAEQAAKTGQPLQNDLKSIAEAASMPFFIRRDRNAPAMSLETVKAMQENWKDVTA